MGILTRVATSAAIVLVWANAAFAMKAPLPAADTAQARVARVAALKIEYTQASVFKDNDDTLLVAAQLNLDESVAASAAAHEKADRLLASASESRRVAYLLTNQPGLSAAQNQKMVVAMEAADAAESEARVAQTYDRLAVASVIANRQAIAKLAEEIAMLARRMDACTALLRSNGYAVGVRQQAPPLDTVVFPSSR